LEVAGSESSFVSFEVFVEDFTFEHVSDSFEASVRVVREATRELDVEMVKDEERIEFSKLRCADNSSDFGSDAFGNNGGSEDFFNGFE
jgi:hypothetical protein